MGESLSRIRARFVIFGGCCTPHTRTVVSLPLTARAIREIGHGYGEEGLERALCEKQRPGAEALLENSQKQRIVAMVYSDPPEGCALSSPV